MLQEIIELQNSAVEKLVALTRQNAKNVYTFRAPTGSGKTYMMADYMNRLLQINSDVVFLVSSLSKSDLAKQNYDKFCEYRDNNGFRSLNPYLINSDIAGEERLYIPADYNVYLLPRDLYKKDSRLMAGPMLNFLHELKWIGGKRIVWIKDECHIATSNLDAIADMYFELTVNFSATPNLGRGQHPDVEITDAEAEQCKLIKTVVQGEDEDTVKDALNQFEQIKTQYRNLLDVNPCLIIQISNKQKADEELNNEILPALNEHPDLKWMLIVNDPKECDTNDVFKAKKLPVAQWKNYARGNLSNIDVIIFKLVISEGWDIPRACMLYQARNSRSKQLDEQVMGRVRRNPRLLDYETLSEEGKKLATMAWVWGVIDNDTRKAFAVKLYDEQKDITDEVRIKTTVIKPLSEYASFDINEFLGNRAPKITHKSIFELNRKLQASDYSVKTMIYDYADDYSKWFHATEYVDDVVKESNQFRCDYSKSMELGPEESFSSDSYYYDTGKYVRINNWVWRRKDGNLKFSFDSDAERDWAELLKDISSEGFKKIKTGKKKHNPLAGEVNIWGEEIKDIVVDEKELYLWGKNYVPESSIKFEYYLGALHSSFPDFIMKDAKGRIHIFEVKSVNQSANFNIDNNIYVAKVSELKKCYKQASILTGQYFYLPIQTEKDWQIIQFANGVESTLSSSQFEKFVSE